MNSLFFLKSENNTYLLPNYNLSKLCVFNMLLLIQIDDISEEEYNSTFFWSKNFKIYIILKTLVIM